MKEPLNAAEAGQVVGMQANGPLSAITKELIEIISGAEAL
jgi:hypothetical protein